MFERDRGRLEDCFRRVNVMPLGAGALAGTVLPIDRKFVAKQLGFAGVCENSMDAVSDRDFAIEFTAACAQIMMHLSRLSEELVIWSSVGVRLHHDLRRLHDRLVDHAAEEEPRCGGADARQDRPGLRQPDRAPDAHERPAARVQPRYAGGQGAALRRCGHGHALALSVYIEMLKGITVHREAMRKAAEDGFITATDLADYLVRKGMPFRQAHEVVGRAVLRAWSCSAGLADLPLAEYKKLSPLIRDDVYDALSVEASVGRRTSQGGTAPDEPEKTPRRAQEAAMKIRSGWLLAACLLVAGWRWSPRAAERPTRSRPTARGPKR